MNDSEPPDPPAKGQFLVYQTEDGRVKIDVRLERETVWLSQQQMADLFQTTKQNVGQHLKNVFEDGELVEGSVVKEFFTTAERAGLLLPRLLSGQVEIKPAELAK